MIMMILKTIMRKYFMKDKNFKKKEGVYILEFTTTI